MTFQELQNIFQTNWLLPWEHDYYVARFEQPKTSQEFLDYAYQSISGLTGIWYEVNGSSVYFIVKKDTVIPEDFADGIVVVTDIPEQPVVEGTE